MDTGARGGGERERRGEEMGVLSDMHDLFRYVQPAAKSTDIYQIWFFNRLYLWFEVMDLGRNCGDCA